MQNLIARDLLSIGAVFLRPDEPFTWASGIKSPIYCDNRLILTAPEVRDGQERVAGINYVAALTKTERRQYGPELKLTVDMASDDFALSVRAARRFVHACAAGRLAGEEMDTTLAYTMAVPARVRAAVMNRTRNEGDILPQITVPVLVTHGTMDRIIAPAAGAYTAESVPGARLSRYDGVGHSPFFEDPKRFNRELAEFVRMASGG